MDDDQQFCLRWNNHQSTLVAVFDTLLENGTLVDCTLAAEGKYLNAHKVVLSACSPYFESLLSQNYDKHPIFILKDVKYQELKAMMDYMYRGEVNISQDQLGALLKAAESLQIKGLSDNRKGETETRKTSQPLPAKSPQPAPSIPRVQGLTIEQRKRSEMADETTSREGSQSPGPRKKKRIRRRSVDDLDNHHDASNSSESHHSNQTPAQNIPTTLPVTTCKIAAVDVPEPVETKSEILTRHKQSEPDVPQVPIIKEKIETHTELMLEPKSEYVDEMNEDSIEDLTLDDDDISNMEQMDDGAGPSHGNAGEGSSQGFGGWHMGNQNQDEVFLAAQEAVGAHRDSQDGRQIIHRAVIALSLGIKKLNKKVESIQQHVMHNSSMDVWNDETETDLRWKLPVQSIADLQILEDSLSEKSNMDILVRTLYLCGGETPHKAIYAQMRKLFHKNMALLYSVEGRKQKLPFIKLKSYEAVIRAVRKRHPDANDIMLKKSIGFCLAGAADWDGGRKDRIKKRHVNVKLGSEESN